MGVAGGSIHRAVKGTKRYPTPRTVIRCCGRWGSRSSFCLSCSMKLSMVRVVPWWFWPQTAAWIWSRESTLPRTSIRQ
jgi:hypothetical protein